MSQPPRHSSAGARVQLAGETGFVLATAIVVLAIITVLIGTAVTVSLQASTSTTRDNNIKASLAAAEAGLQAVTYRLDKWKPEPTECINNTKSITTSNGLCEAPDAEPLGNNATFNYSVSTALTAGESCAGETLASETKTTVWRCVYAEGKINGRETTRLQALVKSSTGESLFSIHGILGLEEVLVNGAVKATSVVASNELIKGEGSAAFEKGFEICPGGKFVPAAGTERNKSGVTVGGIGGMQANPSYEITRSQCPITAKIPTEHPTAASNQDSRISSHEDKDSEQEPNESWNKLEYSGSPSFKLTLSSSPNRLEIGNPHTTATTRYYFCTLTDNGELKIAAGAKVEIFVGDTAEGCSSEGTFAVLNAGKIVNPNGAASLLVEVAGKGKVEIGNSGELAASIFDPEGEVVMSGAGKLTGAIVGKKVKLEAGSFNFSEESSTLIVGGSSALGYSREKWLQCAAGTTGKAC